MEQKYKNLLKNTSILTLSNFASKILTFLLVPLYTSVLSTQEYGIYDLIVATVSMLYPILCLNIVDGVLRFVMDKHAQKEQIFSIGVKISSISCFIAILIIFLTSRLNLFSGIRGLEIYVIFYYIGTMFVQLFVQFAKGLERVSDMAIGGVLGVIVTIAANLIFLLGFHWGLKGFFLSYIGAQFTQILFYILRLKIWHYWTNEKIDRYLLRNMLSYCIPLIVNTLSWSINNSADKYVVTIVLGSAANGILAVAYKIPNILVVLQNIFIQAWQITGIKEYETSGSDVFYGKIFSLSNILMCVACSFLILLTKPLASLLYAKDFYEAWRYVPFLLISNVLNTASGVLGPILSAKKDSKGTAFSAVYGICFNIVCNIVLVNFLGIQGVTIATVISSMVIYVTRRKRVDDSIKEQYRLRKILTWIILCLQAVIAIWLQQILLEIFLFTFIIVMNFPMIIKVLSTFKILLINKKK